MKRIALLFALVSLAAVLGAQDTKTLTVLHTSDMHSRIEPIDPHAADRNAGLGGVVRRSTLVDSLRRHADTDLLLFDCGDFSQGTPYYNLFKGELEVTMMNQMRYDAATIGNHEFDFGLENMARLFRMARFPIVCANYDFTGTVLEGLVRPYVVLKRKGLRIGVFGLSPHLSGLVQNCRCEGVTYCHPLEVAQQVVDRLRNEECCDVVICLSHLGYPLEGSVYENDGELLEHTHGIDLVLGGHTHSCCPAPEARTNDEGLPVYLLHSGARGIHVGQATLTVTKQ